MFKRLGNRRKSVSARLNSHNRHSYSRYTEALSESEDNEGGHWKSRSKKKKSNREDDDLSQPWVCEEIDSFTPKIRYFDFPKTRMPIHIKTYDGSEDPEDHIKIFQAAAKTERWAMPTWCYMFNSTLTGNARVWFDDLPTKSIDSYGDPKKAFLENYLQQKKCIKDPIELHNIKQRDRESIKDFVRRANKTTGKDWRRRAFRFGLDEFHGGKVTISIQWNYWKTRSQKTASSSVNSSWKGGVITLKSNRVKVAINPEYPKQAVMIGSTLTEGGRDKLCGLLQRNLDIFAWKPADMTDVPRHITEHRLMCGRDALRLDKRKEDKQPIETREYRRKLGNLMHVDFKDLNKVCPKDGYPLPEIDWKVESLCGFPFKCFLDAYKGYHQIQMAKEDEEKTAFITKQGIFCYTKMPFGLRNVRATYQRLVDKAFHKQIGRNLELYVDDLVIKSRTEDEIVKDIEETFKTVRKINMKLNPKKGTFGVEEGMFLRYKVSTKGLKICPDKVDVVLSLSSLKCLKDVQKLNGKIASLNRFLAKSVEKSLPFFKTLKKCTKKSDVHWTTKAEEAFKQMRQLIAELPMLIIPMENEELIVYLAAAKETVSANLMTERKAKQMPIYFASTALRDGFGAGLILTNPEGMVFTYALRFRFEPTNNEAKYKALIARLRIAEQMGVKNIQAKCRFTIGGQPIIPVEIGMPTLRTAEVDLVQNEEALRINFDLSEEKREEAAIREGKSKAKMKKYYNSKVRNTSFKLRDLVYRNNDASRAKDTGKLGPKWEGPYEVTEALGNGANKLRDCDEKQLP
uniref:Reverse transcriptase domain-containing protein n=1 Tax=Tanacetum cinerariifolium TaxID=118510 RepID=A0A699GLP2_TANCI|nr:reverse transcriptase domain-containing protein [Tanacetum cinerariifolium]